AQRPRWRRADLREQLDMDPSFLTRVLAGLEERGLVALERSTEDGRALDLVLTDEGREAFLLLDSRSTTQIRELIGPLTPGQRSTLVESMTVISRLVGSDAREPEVTLRGLRAGDMGWVVQRHGEIYQEEFGWDADFEALVARIVADYHEGRVPGRDDAWMGEVDGARAGSVFCRRRDDDTAQLRILLVEPWARGLGLGSRLVDECIDFARSAGYSRLTLWTNDVLVSARRIYEAAGFRLVHEEAHRSFGKDLVGQNWELAL
ncbi:MAG: GNAT family N-acetyltransferase, partial [Actinomycetota bacterium]